MKIAILAWDSLLVNSKDMFIEKWRRNGPVLPLEFSRISEDGKLTVVIDCNGGANNKVFYTISKHQSIDNVIKEILSKEKINYENLGVLNVENKTGSPRIFVYDKIIIDNITDWAKKNKIDTVIWIALGRKFKDKIGIRFSSLNALNYFLSLDGKTEKLALYYLRRVPKQIKTPTRLLLEKYNQSRSFFHKKIFKNPKFLIK